MKYRAWDRERKEWFKVGMLLMDIPTSNIYLDTLKYPNLFSGRFDIQQFIERVDVIGREIYVGDIIAYSYKNGFLPGNGQGEVFYSKDDCAFCVGSTYGRKYFNQIDDIKITGNIYEKSAA